MARKKKLPKDQQETFEVQQLNRTINADGSGAEEAIKALMSPDFEKMSNLDASQIVLMVQEIVRGQNSLIAKMSDEIAKMREHQADADKRLMETLSSERRQIEDVISRSSKLMATGEEHDRIVARGGKMYTQALIAAKAEKSVEKLRFTEQLAHMPKETVTSPGEWIITRNGPQLVPEEVRIKDKVWKLMPGVPTEVPQAVAELLRNRRKSQMETQQLKSILAAQKEQTTLVNEWNNVEGSKRQGLPIA